MCNTCDALRHEFAEDIIRRRLHVRPAEARMLGDMFNHGLVAQDDEPMTWVTVNRIRVLLGKTFIETVRGQGYRLSDHGREKVAQALELAA